MKIAAVVVTFNRSAWLIDCLKTLVAQSLPLSGIVVINNASTDDTSMRLDTFVAAASIRTPQTLWHITHNSVNSGGAGGFAQGMQQAHVLGYDWIWVMDDDVLANINGLAGLMRFAEQGDVLHGQRNNPDGSPFYWQSHFIPWIGFSRPYPDSAFKHSDVWRTNVACFEGALIHRRVFDAVGYAKPEYFIAWDDTEFGYRAAQQFRILYCKTPTLTRQRGHDNIDIGVRSLYRASDMYRYYHIRNRFLLIRTILSLEPRMAARVMLRVSYHSFTLILIAKEIVRAALFREWSLGLRSLYRGWMDGVRGKFGQQPI